MLFSYVYVGICCWRTTQILYKILYIRFSLGHKMKHADLKGLEQTIFRLLSYCKKLFLNQRVTKENAQLLIVTARSHPPYPHYGNKHQSESPSQRQRQRQRQRLIRHHRGRRNLLRGVIQGKSAAARTKCLGNAPTNNRHQIASSIHR